MSGATESGLSQLSADVVALLKRRGLTLAVAESSTGGLIGHLLTETPGSSSVFPGGVIAYDNRLKEALGVPAELLAREGAVSDAVARRMARAAREWAGTAIGLAETGIAGPTGGTDARPVGLFHIALEEDGEWMTGKLLATGDRSGNKRACAKAALELVLRRLEMEE